MKKLLTLLLLFAMAKVGFSQIVISGYFANPPSTDGNYEYIQLVATENIDFSSTPYTVIVSNNGTSTSKGWVEGGFITTGFLLNSGTVSKGDVFYVGGSGLTIAGAGSTDLSGLKWMRSIDFSTNAGDIVGTGKTASGVIANGGSNADGIAVFSGQLTTNDSTKKPIDCVFYGTGIGTAYSSGKGYTVADNDLYKSSVGLFGQIQGNDTNNFLASDPASGVFVFLSGTYNTNSKTWISKRTSSTKTLSTTSVAADIASKITLTSNTPTITVNQAGFTNDFGLTYPNTPSSGSNFVFSGSNLTDSITITVNAPFEIRLGVNTYASGTIKVANTGGTVNTTVLDARFNPTALGVFTDTIYLSSNGAVTQKVAVKGTSSNNPSISFQGASVSVTEGGASVKVQVNIANANSNNTSVDLVVLGASTATAGADFTFTSPQTITFPANSSDSIVVTIPITDDNVYERNETIYFGFANANNGAVITANDTFAVTITDNDYLKVNIGSITKVNGAGVLDSLNGRYEVTGIVYGTNVKTSANGYQLTIRDNTGGVTIFSGFKSYGYSVSQGDSITVKASLVQFNGLAELSLNSSVNTDTVIFHQSNRPLRAPRVVTSLGENEENDFVRFNNVTAKAGNWLSGNQYVYINGGADSIQVRIVPSGHSLIGKPKPTKPFSLIGLGGQFDGSNPFTSGYQLFPRDSNDVIIPADSLSLFNLLLPADNFTDTLKGASTQQIAFSWEQTIAAPGLLTPTYEILFDLPTGDFSAPIATFTSNVGGTSPNSSLTYLVLWPILSGQGISVGQSLSLKWTAKATTTGNYKKLANAPRNITLVRGVMNGINNVANNPLTIFPNPANGSVYIEMPEAITAVTITTMDGKIAKTEVIDNMLYTTLNTNDLASGVYTLSVATHSGVYTKKIAIQH